VAENGGKPQTIEDYVRWSQEHQGRALIRALTSCRNRFPGIGGFIIWMGHDSFPCLANTSILDFTPVRHWDLTLIKGVLIHINPEVLPQVYDKLVAACGRYLMVAEYYNPAPVAIHYRGHSDRLFKRDFAGEIMDRHPQFQLVDYGFAYRRDPNFPQDDITWFLLAK
jgi:hypothetical protein